MIGLLIASTIIVRLGDYYRCTGPRANEDQTFMPGEMIYEDRDCVRISPAGPPEPVWTDGLTERQLEQIEFIVCGPEGANDSIENGVYACNREGWTGQHYVDKK